MSLTNKDKRSLIYFLQNKIDFTNWIDYEEKKEDIQKEYPTLVHAMSEISRHEFIIDLILERIEKEL